MPGFFIARPIFAWVVAILISIAGLLSLPLLPINQYPAIAPPSVSISTSYPGASTQNLYYSVTRVIEDELNGAANILNYESTSDTTGEIEIIVNFNPGTNIELASVDLQNRVKAPRAAPAGGGARAGHRHYRGEQRHPAVRHAHLNRRQSRRGRPRRRGNALRAPRSGACRASGARGCFDRARHARVARPRQAARLEPHAARCRGGDQGAERPSRLGPARGAAEPELPAHPEHGAGQGPARVAGRVRRDRPAAPIRMAQRCGCATWRGFEIERPVLFRRCASMAVPPPRWRCNSPPAATRWPPPRRCKRKMAELAAYFPPGREVRGTPTT